MVPSLNEVCKEQIINNIHMCEWKGEDKEVLRKYTLYC